MRSEYNDDDDFHKHPLNAENEPQMYPPPNNKNTRKFGQTKSPFPCFLKGLYLFSNSKNVLFISKHLSHNYMYKYIQK